MSKILVLGRVSRLRDEIEKYLTSNNYDIQALDPSELNYTLPSNSDISHCIVLHEFPVFRNYKTLERVMKLNCNKVIIITSDYSLNFKREIAKCNKAQVIYRPFLPKELILSLTQDKH